MTTLSSHLQISYISRNFVSVGAEILLKYLQQALSRVFNTSYSNSKEEMEVANMVKP